MAKDRRNKAPSRLDLENEVRADKERRASRATPPPKVTRPSPSKAPQPRKKKKKKLSRAAIIIYSVLAALIVLLIVTLIVGGIYFVQQFDTQAPTRDPVSPIDRDTTPIARREKVGYYLFGILGEGHTDSTTMLSVVCHDKVNKTVNVLELPASTYLETGDNWKVDTLGKVYANPKALDWCDTCKKRLYAPEITEGEESATHTECGTIVTSKKGSAIGGIVDFINDQLGLPIDEYCILEPESLEILVDSVGGVDVELSSARMLGDINYEPGVQTLTGPAAVDFILESEGAQRTANQREVLGALLVRLQRMSDEDINAKVAEDLMDSEHPMRTDLAFSETLKNDEITALISSFKDVALDKITVRMLPGESTYDSEGDHVFSAHKQELLDLLNASYNPHGEPIVMTDLLIPELSNTVSADLRQGTLNQYVSDQVGTILDTE
ncbi:MAG: LCP family protein [Clostridia bacterium]|nr:LCP family protein [Clostridia bacterium]